MNNRLTFAALALVAVAGAPFTAAAQQPVDPRPANGVGQTPAFVNQTDAPEEKKNVAFDVVTVAEGLQNPWGLAFLPDGRMLVTEKAGRLRIVTPDGKLSEPVAGLPMVDPRAQGGLLDVAIDPDYRSNGLIYWSYSEPRDGGTNNTAVARGKLVDGPAPKIDNLQVIFHQSPSLNSPLHFGSRLVFGRDKTLFVTMGDRSIEEGRAQAPNLNSLLGKIARINRDGSIPKDNPFVGKEGARPEIWSYGHRNVQAATLHPTTGELWETEMGTQGGDEMNIARKGKDYGWPNAAYGVEYGAGARPIREGLTQKPGTEQPVYYWDPVIAPSGMTIYSGNLFPAWKGSVFIGSMGGGFPGMGRRGGAPGANAAPAPPPPPSPTQSLVRLTIKDEKVTGEERLLTDMSPRERIRNVVQGPEGALYLLTDNAQGRVLKLVPKK